MHYTCQIGSTPFARNALAEGAVRKRMSDFAVSGLARMPTARQRSLFRLQFLWNGTHHVDSADVDNARGDDKHKIGIPSRHNFDGVFRPIGLSLPCISFLIPMRSSRLTKYNPLAPFPG